MYEQIKEMALKLLKLPPEPNDPMGEVKDLKVFRASRNYLLYNLFFWGASNLFGIVVLLVAGVAALRIVPKQAAAGRQTEAFVIILSIWALLLIIAVVKTVVGYVMTRLNYEMRWYKVSDRSLRIREGVTFVQEITMTFANIQNISISQGPVQRMLGIADLKLESAGGGSSLAAAESQPGGHGQMGFNAHVAYFRGIDNAQAIRQLISDRLKLAKDSGLGDHDDSPAALPSPVIGSPALAIVLKELRSEAQALREAAEACPA